MPCPNPYELLGPVRVLRKELGLTTNDLAVLTALISFLPRKEREIQDSQRLIKLLRTHALKTFAVSKRLKIFVLGNL